MGLFSIRRIPKGTLVSYFNGFKVPEGYVMDSYIQKLNGKENFENMKIEDPLFMEYVNRKSYLIALDPDHDLDIPPEIANDSEKYRATLGHKVNHWFQPNSYFSWAVHPLYGRSVLIRKAFEKNISNFRIRSLVSLREIKAGEEITVDYDYDLDDRFTPQWYKNLHKHFYNM